jgi:hypothetical protein
LTLAEELTESPIEEAMLAGLLRGVVYAEAEFALSGRGIDAGVYRGFFVERSAVTAMIVPQLRIRCPERYRLDFGVVLERGARRVHVALECDGFNFHSAGADVKRDKARDRALAAAGWIVLRFPGQEIVNGDESAAVLAWGALLAIAETWCGAVDVRIEAETQEPLRAAGGA